MKEVVTDVEVENDVDLSFSLASKYLPVVYEFKEFLEYLYS